MAPPRCESRLQRVLAAFERAANSGSAAPTNHDLSLMLGMSSVSGPVPLVKELERRGLIRVERFHRERRVTIVATGRQTWADPREEKPGRFAHVSPAAVDGVIPIGVPLFRPFTKAEAAAFDDALADGAEIEAAALAAGRSPLDGYRQFHRVCAALGEYPAGAHQEGAAPGIRGQQEAAA